MSRRSCFLASIVFLAFARLSPGAAAPEETPSPSPSPSPVLYSPQTIAELKKLQQAALASDYAYRQVAHLSNNIGPRLSGSAQAQKAVEYVAGELKALGLEVKLEKVMVPHWVRGEETAALVQFPGQAPETKQKLVLTALGGSVATPAEGLIAEVVVVRDFDELNSLGKNKVAGKIVVFNHAFDKQMAAQGRGGEAYGEAVVYRSDAPSAAARLGAVAALIRSVGGATYRLPHTGATKYSDDAPKIPAAALAEEDALLLADLAPQGPVRMHLVLTPQQLPDAVSYNVIGDLKGSQHPEQVVIVSGHLDSWDLGTGAIDDGAGVAAAMQAAQLVRQLGLRPKRTIRVVAWMNEENGLRGGKTYAAEHAGEVANHFAAIETDGGANRPVGIYIAGKPEIKPMLEPIAKVLRASGAGLLQMRDGVGADIDPLAKLGVPNFSPIQDSRFYFNYHHTAADTLDKIDPRELAENAAVNAVLAYGLANLEQPLPR
ncbi:MAG: M20/M25/M40 family metallo-hydrolase [Chthoniobacterales bacterium]|nr:M20/M25/M40 family metallo-hydrolase [Chthoniobacterales bacterium]